MLTFMTIAQLTGLGLGNLISNAFRGFGKNITLEHFICLPGLAILAYWLLTTSLGRNALKDSIPRRNNMPFYMPFVPLFIWFALASIGGWLMIKIGYQLSNNQWIGTLLDNLILGFSEIVTIIVMLVLAKLVFVRGLKGFGLGSKTILTDIPAALVNLLSAWPLVLVMVIFTMFVGQYVWGQDYQIQRHEQLNTLTMYHQFFLRVIVIVISVIVVPVFEEMLFRGFFQTMLRSFLQRPWPSIFISSVLFAGTHQMGHWPALFVLAVCLGYAYEKSGSLWRPIFIHALFNGITIAATLSTGN
jgi:membrane protease YdiL (CAAX protease family)